LLLPGRLQRRWPPARLLAVLQPLICQRWPRLWWVLGQRPERRPQVMRLGQRAPVVVLLRLLRLLRLLQLLRLVLPGALLRLRLDQPLEVLHRRQDVAHGRGRF
jgi:hypothetical protein